jgi:hypothetical protein
MDKLITPVHIDDLAQPLQTELSRRQMLKHLGAGSLAIASAAVLSPLGAEAATSASLSAASLRLYRSGSDVLVRVYYTARLNNRILYEIRHGARYGVWFMLRYADRSPGSDGDYYDEFVHAWSSGPLPAQSPFVHSTSQRLNYSDVRTHGREFYAQLLVFKRVGANRIPISSTVSTSTRFI